MKRILPLLCLPLLVQCGVTADQHRRDLNLLEQRIKSDFKNQMQAGMERAETRFGNKLNEQMEKVNEVVRMEPELKSLKIEVETLIARVDGMANSLEGKVDLANENVVKSLEAQKKYLEDLLINIEALLKEMEDKPQ